MMSIFELLVLVMLGCICMGVMIILLILLSIYDPIMNMWDKEKGED